MSLDLLWERDIDPSPLAGRRVGIIGYGNQGRAQALNLRDAGVAVRVGIRPGSASLVRAATDGIESEAPAAVARWADVLVILAPEERQPALLEGLGVELGSGRHKAIGFAHGFNVTYEQVALPRDATVFLVAPCAPGERMREAFVRGGGVFAYVAVHQDPDGRARELALAYARALGCARAGVFLTTFKTETEVDLFGEQAVLCGGMHALLTAAFDVLVEAGYPAEMAYLECHHQLVWLAATVHAEGIAGTRRRISSTALYGDLTRGPRVIGEPSREALRLLLQDIRSGRFAREFLEEVGEGGDGGHETGRGRRRKVGGKVLEHELARMDSHPMEAVGRRLRALGRLEEAAPGRTATNSGRAQRDGA